MSNKTDFLLQYGKNGVHYDYEHEFHKSLESGKISRGVFTHPNFSERHLTEFIDSSPSPHTQHIYNMLRYAKGNGMLKQHHIEQLFDQNSTTEHKQDVSSLPGSELSPKIGHWMFDNGNLYKKIQSVKMHPSVARKVLDEIAASKSPDHVHPSSVWQAAIENKDAATPHDLEIAKKSGHSVIKHTASIQ